MRAFRCCPRAGSGPAVADGPVASALAPARPLLPGENPGKLARAKLSAVLAGVDQPEPQLRLRGAKEIELYRKLAPSVAIILTDEGLGSASLIEATAAPGSSARTGILLTCAHVVGDAREVAVIFKPKQGIDKIKPADAVVGRVLKVDPVRDLALVEVANVPPDIEVLGRGTMNEVQVGADVHAIGHPVGQIWTYTKGMASQIYPAYEWRPDASNRHVADVIETQTPINPGNSGGPLIGDDGKLIGVNAFKNMGGEALNFAVSIGEVEMFLAAAREGAYEPQPASAAPKACRPKVTYEGRSRESDAFIRTIDLDCGGKPNAGLSVPDDKTKPIVLRIDNNRDGKVDAWIVDEDRDGKWDYSLWDTDFDGKPDIIGYHPDGDAKPSRLAKYQPKS